MNNPAARNPIALPAATDRQRDADHHGDADDDEGGSQHRPEGGHAVQRIRALRDEPGRDRTVPGADTLREQLRHQEEAEADEDRRHHDPAQEGGRRPRADRPVEPLPDARGGPVRPWIEDGSGAVSLRRPVELRAVRDVVHAGLFPVEAPGVNLLRAFSRPEVRNDRVAGGGDPVHRRGVLAADCRACGPSRRPGAVATKAIGEEIGRHRSIRRFLESRLERGVATGLALTLALVATIAAGILIGVLIYMVRSQTGLVQVDRAVERWSDPRMTPLSIATLGTVTQFGATVTVVALGLATAGYAVWRWRSRAIPLFLAIVIGGQLLLSDLIKGAVQRTRPGPAAARALHRTVVPERAHHRRRRNLRRDRDRGRPRRIHGPQMLLAGVAVALAVAVGCSRVFLGVHWVTDAIGGLVLGWTWVAVVAIAFGGRVMRFAAPVKAAVAPEPSRFGGEVQGTGVGPPQREEIQ